MNTNNKIKISAFGGGTLCAAGILLAFWKVESMWQVILGIALIFIGVIPICYADCLEHRLNKY